MNQPITPQGNTVRPFDINRYHQAHAGVRLPLVPWITCADGFTMSVQASQYHYSEPRDDRAWPYEAFEVGFPSEHEALLAPYGSLTPDEDPAFEQEVLSDVYGWVPAGVINDIVFKHGGIK